MNRVVLTGRLGKDPELKYTPKGEAYCRFTLAVTERYKGKKETYWVNIVVWQKLAEVCKKYLSKGSKIGLFGRIRTGSYEKNGQKIPTFEVLMDELEFLGEKEHSGQAAPEDSGGLDLPF